jgi:hypothetical protein
MILSDWERFQWVQETLFRDEQLDIAGAGEKVRELIEEHVYSTGVDPKFHQLIFLQEIMKRNLISTKSSRLKASERLRMQLSTTFKSILMKTLNITRNFRASEDIIRKTERSGMS